MEEIETKELETVKSATDVKIDFLTAQVHVLISQMNDVNTALNLPSFYYNYNIPEQLRSIKNVLIELLYELDDMCNDDDLNFITFKKLSTYRDKFKNIVEHII